MPPEPDEPVADLNPSPDQPSMSSTDEADAAPPAAPTKPQLQRTQTDSSLRSCFICLQTPSETPNAAWVNACPCSLEAHEDCVLRWISEHERESTKTLRCPACKGRIQTTEPKDSFVGLRDRLHKMYSRITPAILLGVVTGCSMASSSYYGMLSMCVFAGPGPAMSWLGLGRALEDRRINSGVPWYRSRAAWEFCFRFWILNFIAPALMIQKALPSQLVDMLTLPASLLYGVSLVLRDEMPTWPPSPAWVMTMMPWVSFSYNRIYYDLLGGYERRLNRALRGRGLPNEQLPDAENAEGGQQANAAAENAAPADEDDEGYFAQAVRVGNAVLNLMGDENNQEAVVAEIELHIGPDEDEAAAIQELQDELNDQGIIVVEERADDGAGNTVQAAEQLQEQNASGGVEQEVAEPPPAIRVEPQANGEQNPPPNNNVNNNNNQAQEEMIRERNGGPSTTLTDLVNGVVSAITFPLVCWGAGEFLRHILPDSWIMRTHTRAGTGLLQEQWGRSLVGGMVFVVARDAVNLYTKHRRVEVRKHRRVRNVPRRKPKQAQTQQANETT
ncbi:hypothetical protein DHEL01_v202536 [Diaporthe helianthi]|uniref:Uncharacterized protein n=1 Tax=Diaporthe helianthi TaxID=158607 RepID=A0A2P5I9B1_DIAHE|nr:hypothetical protein DHEL01_v202536 [Diaporthe helianthi]